jgi:predicted AAA+ superfamily ATPase
MDTRFVIHNSHLDDAKNFSEVDPDLCALKTLHFQHNFALLDQLPITEPGIYTLCGGHLTGKTTLLKSWMMRLLQNNVTPNAIAFIAAHLIDDYHQLHRVMQKQLSLMPRHGKIFLILDDITSIHDWDKAIALIAKEEVFENITLMLSCSDLSLKEAVQKKFPALRGNARLVDFHLYPLSFREAVMLKHSEDIKPAILFEEFNQYLKHGGYLIAINDIETHGHIQDATLTRYFEAVRKGVLNRGKHERYLNEILNAIFKYYNEQTTWNALATELSIDHPKTIGDYFALLESMDVVFVQYALLEETLQPAPKKARKLMFTDPFVFHAMQAALSKSKNHFEAQINAAVSHSDTSSKLVESCIIMQFKRIYPTYYIKSEGEVDLAYVHNQRFWPIEITWANQIRAKDLKQILKYPNGRILTKTDRSGIIEHIKTEPLPLALWQLQQ